MPTMLVRINVDDGGNVAIQKLAQNASKAQPKVKSLGDTMKNAFAVIGVYKGINMLSAKLMQATDEALKFEKAMKKIKAIGNESAGTMGKMEKEIEKFALTTEHSFTQIAEAQLGISKAGIRGSEGMEVLKNALDLATVAGEEQGAVSEGLINILNTFQMGTDKAGYAANVMSRALNETVLNLEDYLYAMTYAAPLANQLGVSFEELSAMIGILAQTGQKGSLAGTGLRNVMLNMLKLTPATAAALKDVKIEEMGVTDLLKTLNDNGLPVIDLLKQFNKRGILAAAALGDNADAVYDLQTRLTDLSRPLSTVADEMRDNLFDKLQMLNDHFVMILNTLNKEMGSGGNTVIDNLMAKMVDFNEMLKDNPQLLKDWTRALEGVGNTLTMLVPIMGFAVEHSREIIIALSVNKLIAISGGFTTLGKSIKGAFAKGAWQGPAGLLIASLTTMYTLAVDITEQFKKMRMAEIDSDDPVAKRLNTLNALVDMYEQLIGGGSATTLIPQIKEAEERLMGLGTQIKFTTDYQKNLNQAYDEYNKILRTGASVGIGEGSKPVKITKPFGSNLTQPEVKEDKNKFDDAYGKMFDMHHIEGGFQESLKRLQAGLTELVIPVDVEANDEIAEKIRKIYEDGMSEIEKLKPEPEAPDAWLSQYQQYQDIVMAVSDSIMEYKEAMHNRQLEIYSEEMEAVTERYNTEIAMAGDSALQKSLAENKYQKEKEKIDEKVRQENKKAAQARYRAKLLEIALTVPVMTVNFINTLSEQMPPYVAVPLGTGLAAGIAGLQTAAAAVNNPADAYFTGGWVRGSGNATSDSNTIRASKGEYVLSRDDVDRLGGDSAINRMVAFGDTHNNNSTTSIYIDTVIGEENYIRKNIIPRLKEELKR